MLIDIVDTAHNFQPIKIEPDQTEAPEDRTAKIQSVIESLRVIFKSVQRYSTMIEAQYDLSVNQLWALWELSKSPGLKVSELATAVSIHLSTASNLLDKLEQRSLIRRERQGPDQRVVRLFLTPEGWEVINQAPRPAQAILVHTLLKLPDKTLKNLEAGLAEVVAKQGLRSHSRKAGTPI